MIKNFLFNKPVTASESYHLALKSFRIDPNQDFALVKSRIGLEASLCYAHLYFSNQTNFKRLRRELDLHQREYNQLNSDVDVLIVSPPRGFLPNSVTQPMARQCLGLAMTAGFAHVSHAHLNANNAIEGARRLTRLIEDKRRLKRKVILVSYSFGSTFVRIMLDHLPHAERDHLKGWLNISGLIFGSPRFHCSNKLKFLRKSDISHRSFSSEQKYFSKGLDLEGVKTVHLLGVKNWDSLSLGELRDREYLRAWGPNDGLIPFAQYQKVPGPVMTVLNQGHVIDMGSMGSTYVKILSSMVSTVPLDRRLRDTANESIPQLI